MPFDPLRDPYRFTDRRNLMAPKYQMIPLTADANNDFSTYSLIWIGAQTSISFIPAGNADNQIITLPAVSFDWSPPVLIRRVTAIGTAGSVYQLLD